MKRDNFQSFLYSIVKFKTDVNGLKLNKDIGNIVQNMLFYFVYNDIVFNSLDMSENNLVEIASDILIAALVRFKDVNLSLSSLSNAQLNLLFKGLTHPNMNLNSISL